MKTSRNLVGDSGKLQKTIKFKWCGLWTMEFLGGKMSAAGWESRVELFVQAQGRRGLGTGGVPQ